MDGHEPEITQDLYSEKLYSISINPANVTFYVTNPNNEKLKEEEELFLPFIAAYALDIAKHQCKLENLGQKQAQYENNLRELITPKNTPKSTLVLIELCQSDDLKRSLIAIASSHLNMESKITEQTKLTSELRTVFPYDLTVNAAKAGRKIIKFTETHSMTLLDNEVTRHRVRFTFNETQQALKKDLKEQLKQKKETPKATPTIESLTLKINQLEKLLKPKANSKKIKLKQNPYHQRKTQVKPRSSNPKQVNPLKRPPPKPAVNTQVRKGMHKLSSTLTTITNRETLQSSSLKKGPTTLIRTLPSMVNKDFKNLTSDNLSEYSTLLGFGLKFIPNPSNDIDKESILPLVNTMLDRAKWKYYFTYQCDLNSNRTYQPQFKLPTTPFPDNKMDMSLRVKTNLIKREVTKILTNNPAKRCFEHPLIKKLRNLKSTLPSTKLIASDKNLGLVALNTIDYHKLVMLHLSDKSTYQDKGLIEALSVTTLTTIVNNAFTIMKNISKRIGLTSQQDKFVSDKRSKLPAFHVIAKIHKTPLSGRPLVGATDWVTTRFSILLDVKLQPYLKQYPSILKDSPDLINRWHNTSFDDSSDWLVSLDVISLYTNIIVKDAVTEISKHNLHLANLASVIMKNNYFEYNSKLFHQKEGIAMGTNCAVAIANLYMATLIDNKLICLPNIRCYSRFIDDICFIYSGTKEHLEELITSVNSHHPKLQFTSVISKHELDVLDLTFYPKNGKIEYRTYQKSLNKYLYIPRFSNHPPSTIRGFIKGELTRYSRTNSNFDTLLAIKKLFYKRLLLRGYSRAYLNNIFHSKPRGITPATKIDPEFNCIQVLPYLKSTRIKLLKEFFNNTDLIPDPFKKIITVWSTTPSLSQIILRSKLSKEQSAYLKSNGYF